MLQSSQGVTDVSFESLSSKDFRFIQELIRERAGIVIADDKQSNVNARLRRRMRKLKLRSFSDYCKLLREGEDEELQEVINALTTNFTSFFREPHHFDFLRDRVVPEFSKTRGRDSLRIWSSASSTGEEPYSIAITLLRAGLSANSVRILATDIDSAVLDTASQGVYDMEAVDSFDSSAKKTYLQRGTGNNDGKFRVGEEARSCVHFKQLNLLAHTWPKLHPFDVIFCRNVIIYFSTEDKIRLVKHFAQVLRPGGYLFLGHSETIPEMREYQSTAYRIHQRTT
ncbi:MAG: protein-glutamate O-methyltransferase CheR [Myxococcota bacterium]